MWTQLSRFEKEVKVPSCKKRAGLENSASTPGALINSLKKNDNLHETTALTLEPSYIKLFCFSEAFLESKYVICRWKQIVTLHTIPFPDSFVDVFLLDVVFRAVRQQQERDVFTLVRCRFECAVAEKLCVFLSGIEAVCLCFYD